MSCVVIFNHNHGWHSQQLASALVDCKVEIIYSNLSQCKVDLSLPFGLYIPGLNNQLPDGVVVRGIAGGSLEQISFRLDILHCLEKLGVPIFNNPSAIERTVDKARTSFLLHHKAIPTPRTWVCETKEQAQAVIVQAAQENYQLIIKPLFGSQGRGISFIDRNNLEKIIPEGELYYLQEYISPAIPNQWKDWRIFVIQHRTVAAMIRYGQSWITNAAQGAICIPIVDLDSEINQLACQATRAVGVDYGGVDIIQSINGYQVLEVNSIPAWKALQRVTKSNLAQTLVNELIIKKLKYL
ncbi:RimK family alpha-L-glutamate ligase [Candidatus Nitrosacidococcus sp. I8]|uniref:RimK family alpha-L-glutamate ligase n=1 Tax=Candidatus Nitrosacidococcus sp. I8 TaxID=2942908 RepID=UPI002227F001|nr:RimK family alpha-L-glutamate ligase [Candidatus Nitrosacidococcus sp. I8]CAH9014537.1 Glutathione synthetase [Candidatus Nitrosacidococcus sp. I8]